MAKVKGILLTLGITFLSLIVLTLATIILKNAETSEDRLMELGSLERTYNIDTSIQKSLRNLFHYSSGFNLTIRNNTNFVLSKEMVASSLEDKILNKYFEDFIRYTQDIKLFFTWINVVDNYKDYIALNIKPNDIDYYYGKFNVNSSISTASNSYQHIFTKPEQITALNITIRSTLGNATFNWTVPIISSTNGIVVNITIFGQGTYVNSSSRVVNLTDGSSPSLLLYLENLGTPKPFIVVHNFSGTSLPASGYLLAIANTNNALNMTTIDMKFINNPSRVFMKEMLNTIYPDIEVRRSSNPRIV